MNNVSHRRFDWFSLLIGILFILGGFLSFSRPDKTLHLLSVIIGVVFLFDGIFELTIRRRFLRSLGEGTGWIVVLGILNIILGIIFIFHPGFGNYFCYLVYFGFHYGIFRWSSLQGCQWWLLLVNYYL